MMNKKIDIKPFLNMGIFKELKDTNKFKAVRPVWESIQWKSDHDVYPDTLYEESITLNSDILRINKAS